jgi:hypothetical protein
MSQQGKRQREESEGEPTAMRVRWADLQPESTQQTEIFWQDFDYVKISETIDIQRMTTYIQMYLVAEFFDDTPMRVETLDVIMANMTLCKNVPGFRLCGRVWERTPKGSPLRSVTLRWISRRHSPSNFAANPEKHPKEFLEEMAALLIKQCRSPSSGQETTEEFAAKIRAQLLDK